MAIALLLAMALEVGCDGRRTTGPAISVPALIPLAVGNHWIYRDSLFTSVDTLVSLDTVAVVSLREEAGRVWYRLRHVANPSIASDEFMSRIDSTFSLQRTDGPGGIVVPIVSLEYVRPPASGSATFVSIFDGDVLLEKSVSAVAACSSPAGTFASCVVYTYRIFPEQYLERVVPGLGIVAIEIRADASIHGPAWRFQRELVEHRVIPG